MIRLYLKQAWMMVKQNRLFTTIYVAGTALAIATTMIMAIVYYVKIAPIYPEVNRNRTLYMTSSCFMSKAEKWRNQWGYSLLAVKEWFYPLKNAVAVSAEFTQWSSTDFIQPFDNSGDFQIKKRDVDPAFFRIYHFRFLEGKPFTEADLESGIRSAVISDRLARRIFGTESGVVGKSFTLNYLDYRVAGVVEEASFLTHQSFGQVYVPYSTVSGYDGSPGSDFMPYYGSYQITLLVDSDEQEAALRDEINEIVRKYNASQEQCELVIHNQPRTHLLTVFQRVAEDGFSWASVVREYLIILLVLLLVPALNLSGMIAGRMETRLAEMGIRKSFGACRSGLLRQVMWENLVLTLAGGLLGLMLAWVALVAFRDWVFALFDERPNMLMDSMTTQVSGEMLLAPSVFIAALLLCVLLNLLSALIPAWNSLRHPIIQSLNEKR